MKKIFLIRCLPWMALSIGCIGTLPGQTSSDQIVIKAKSQDGDVDLSVLMEKFRATKIQTLPGKAEVWKLPNGTDGAVQALNKEPQIKFAEPFLGKANELFSIISTNDIA